MRKKFIERFCVKCEYCSAGEFGIYCRLTWEFSKEIKICPKKMTILQIQNSCGNFILKMDDGKTGCMGDLDSGRCLVCRINKIEDLLNDTRFELKRKFLTKKGRKR